MNSYKTLAVTTVLSSIFMVTGCNSTTGMYGNNPNNLNNATKGAAAGAVTGALIRSGGNSKDIARGALAGAAIGGAGGYILDESQKND